MYNYTKTRQDQRVLIFSSTIKTKKDAEKVDKVLSQLNTIQRWTIDLDDWEKVMKVESNKLTCSEVEAIIESLGYRCSELNH